MDFAPNNGSMDVLNDVDYDSLFNLDSGVEDSFNFETSAFLDGNPIGAE